MHRAAVSIVIPAKNEAQNLDAVLAALWISVARYGEGEVIVVDNGSTDATCSVALEHNCKVVIDPYVSIAGLRNLGARQARGRYLGFLDADCLVDPDWVSCCVERLLDHSIGLVGTRAVPDLSHATWVEEGWYRLVAGAPRPDNPAWIGSSNMFLRKEVFDEVLGFNEELKTAEDVEFCKKVSRGYRICLEKRIVTIHLRESKNVLQLIRREMWRGRYSIRQLMVSNDKASELASVVVPVSMVLFSLLSVTALIWDSKLQWSICSILFFPLVMMVHKKVVCRSPREIGIVYLVSLFYLVARAFASVQEMVDISGAFLREYLGKLRLGFRHFFSR